MKSFFRLVGVLFYRFTNNKKTHRLTAFTIYVFDNYVPTRPTNHSLKKVFYC